MNGTDNIWTLSAEKLNNLFWRTIQQLEVFSNIWQVRSHVEYIDIFGQYLPQYYLSKIVSERGKEIIIKIQLNSYSYFNSFQPMVFSNFFFKKIKFFKAKFLLNIGKKQIMSIFFSHKIHLGLLKLPT